MENKTFSFDLIGHDAEFIVRDNETSQPVSMVEVVQETMRTCTVYPDNVLLELNTDPVPLSYFPSLIKENLLDLNCFLEDMGCYTNIGEAEALYPQDELCSKQAHQIGCIPFENAYLLGVPLTPKPYGDNWRFAGGHIHLSYDKNVIPSHILVRMLDDKFKGKDNKTPRRDEFYGQLGSYREKSYGIEYRSLSNFWMNNPEMIVEGVKEIEAQINKDLQG